MIICINTLVDLLVLCFWVSMFLLNLFVYIVLCADIGSGRKDGFKKTVKILYKDFFKRG